MAPSPDRAGRPLSVKGSQGAVGRVRVDTWSAEHTPNRLLGLTSCIACPHPSNGQAFAFAAFMPPVTPTVHISAARVVQHEPAMPPAFA
jgi:hypothetical protein